MRVPSLYVAYCVLVLAGFALAKELGFDGSLFAAWSRTVVASGGGSSSSGGSSGGYSSGSSSHK